MKNSIWYINWNAATHIRLTQEEYNEKFQWFCRNGFLVDNRKGKGNRVRRLSWMEDWSYCVEQDHQQVNLYTKDNKGQFTVYYTNTDTSKNNRDQGVSGGAAFDLVNTMFWKRHDKSLQAAFGRDERFVYDSVNMALAPIIYVDQHDCDYVLNNIYKADVSSAYPYGLFGDLPDTHEKSKKVFSGVYPPTPEYPFAFYIRSGHMAIYNELDTYRDFRLHPMYQTRAKFKNELYGDNEITILLKASRFNLDDIMQDLYDRKGEDPTIKTKMVAFIGYIRSTKSWQHHYMGHISACVYARHIKRMLAFYDAIVADHNKVKMIATDSICWQGHAMPSITTKEKRIGNFVSEYENAKLLMLANGVYGLEADGKIVCFKHQGTAAEDIGIEIHKLTDIKKLKSMPIRAFDKISNKFVEVDPVLHTRVDI